MTMWCRLFFGDGRPLCCTRARKLSQREERVDDRDTGGSGASRSSGAEDEDAERKTELNADAKAHDVMSGPKERRGQE